MCQWAQGVLTTLFCWNSGATDHEWRSQIWTWNNQHQVWSLNVKRTWCNPSHMSCEFTLVKPTVEQPAGRGPILSFISLQGPTDSGAGQNKTGLYQPAWWWNTHWWSWPELDQWHHLCRKMMMDNHIWLDPRKPVLMMMNYTPGWDWHLYLYSGDRQDTSDEPYLNDTKWTTPTSGIQ